MTDKQNTGDTEEDYRRKGRAVFLAAIMVLAVVAATIAFSGASV